MAEHGYSHAGAPTTTNSAAAYGSVMHHALQVFERERAVGVTFELALQKSLDTFVHYWHPTAIEAICEPVPTDGWLPTHSYGALLNRGIDALKKYADLMRYDDHELLATEHTFMVPILGSWDEDLGQPHILAGAVDRLAVRHYKRAEYLCLDDWKMSRAGHWRRYLRRLPSEFSRRQQLRAHQKTPARSRGDAPRSDRAH
jgi:hypothetical protein